MQPQKRQAGLGAPPKAFADALAQAAQGEFDGHSPSELNRRAGRDGDGGTRRKTELLGWSCRQIRHVLGEAQCANTGATMGKWARRGGGSTEGSERAKQSSGQRGQLVLGCLPGRTRAPSTQEQ
eukprot:g38.t1